MQEQHDLPDDRSAQPATIRAARLTPILSPLQALRLLLDEIEDGS
jgi:hypothetical protein